MGQRYERSKRDVSENKKSLEKLDVEREALRSEYAPLSLLDGLQKLLDDEAVGAIQDVRAAGELESERISAETDAQEGERGRIRGEVENEIAKLSAGLEALRGAGDHAFGRGAIERSSEAYKKQIDQFEALLSDMDEKGARHAGHDGRSFESGAVERGAARSFEGKDDADDLKMDDFDDAMRSVLEQSVQPSVIPSSGGAWTGEKGNSFWKMDDDAVVKWRKAGKAHQISGRAFKEKYRVEGVAYRKNEPDFEPFEDEKIGHVVLDEMPDHRARLDGSYAAATRAVAEKLNVTEDEIKEYMESHELTWHECGDRRTVRAIPTGVNAAFKHSGGISMQKSKEAIGEGLREKLSENQGAGFTLQRSEMSGTVPGGELERAIAEMRQNYRRLKSEK